MSKKGYTKVEREQVGRDLLTVGLEMLSQRGLKGTTLQDILQAVGISKPFFYGNYYTSLAELVIHIIDYEQVLALWQIPQEKCSPKELGNLILSVVLIYNSAARSLPFFFPEELEQTAKAQATALSRYLASLADADK